MPSSSTIRRVRQSEKIDKLGITMPVKCGRCRKNDFPCKVHISSGRCLECVKSNATGCDIRVTASEWQQIKSGREKILAELERAEEEIELLFARRRRLRKQLALLDRRGKESITVDDRELQEEAPSASVNPGTADSVLDLP